jgi:DNA-binding YbaB/EbfC family protein
MARGRHPGFGGANPNNLMRQVQKMQKDMLKLQEELGEKTVESSVGGGAISVVANGNKEILKIDIKPEVVDPDDIEMLQDLIMAAVNEALKKVEELTENEMGKLQGGLPGLF